MAEISIDEMVRREASVTPEEMAAREAEAPDPAYALTTGIASGGYEGAGAVAGGALGAPFGPPGILLGGAGGAYAGHLVRKLMSNVENPMLGRPFAFTDKSELRPGEEPYGVAGETIGGAAGLATAPYVAAARGAQPASRILQGMVNAARTSPVTFGALEAAGAAGSGVGAGMAEAVAPGDPYVRLGAEAAGGFVGSGGVTGTVARGGLSLSRLIWQGLNPQAQKDEAARLVQDVIRNVGDDPEKVVDALQNLPLDLPGTSAQVTGYRGLIRLENTLKRSSETFAGEARTMADEALKQLRQNISVLTMSGEPSALRAAAVAKKRYFDLLMMGRIQEAENTAQAAALRISPEVTKAQASRAMESSLDGALREARDHEKSLWSRVDRASLADSGSVLEAYQSVRSELLPEQSLPAIVEGWIRRHHPEPDERGNLPEDIPIPTTGDLIKLRSNMLALMRGAKDSTDERKWINMRVYGEIAEAALDDLDAALGHGADDAYNTARAFSRSLNDRFTRTFAGTALDTGPAGRRRIPPELLGSRAFAGEGGRLRFEEMRQATRLLPDFDPEAAGDQYAANMMAAQEQFLMAAAKELVGPDGRISVPKLNAFLASKAETLTEFPNVAGLLRNAREAEDTLNNVRGGVHAAQRQVDRFAAFARVAGTENPDRAIQASLGGKFPLRELRQLARLARADGPTAIEGYRSALMQHAMNKATSRTGRFSFPALFHALKEPIAKGQPSILSFMRREGLLDGEQYKSVHTFFEEATKREIAAASPERLDELVAKGDMFSDFVLRIAGANIGGMGAMGRAAGTPLVAAYAGSRAFRMMFDQVPVGKVRGLIEEAALDPQKMAVLLARPVTPRQKMRLTLQMNAWLWNAGLLEPGTAALEGSGEAF